jgi:hypothetical protein
VGFQDQPRTNPRTIANHIGPTHSIAFTAAAPNPAGGGSIYTERFKSVLTSIYPRLGAAVDFFNHAKLHGTKPVSLMMKMMITIIVVKNLLLMKVIPILSLKNLLPPMMMKTILVAKNLLLMMMKTILCPRICEMGVFFFCFFLSPHPLLQVLASSAESLRVLLVLFYYCKWGFQLHSVRLFWKLGILRAVVNPEP